nr:phosphotransferase [Lachnospiraceae bacterium]
VILRLKKSVPDVSLINVSSEVYEIFEMTGFTEMMDVQKAYRVISVDGCEVIGQGANGKVYRIDPDTIVKVYLNPDALPEIHRERELARTAFVLGIPTAIPYDVVKIKGGGYGSVFELLNATSFAKLLIRKEKELDEVVGMSVDLLKLIHSTEVKPDSMPDMRAVALNWTEFLQEYLAPELYEKLHALVEAVPVDHHMMHGDYHIKNVMLQNGEILLIDMDTLCYGHPIFELASMYNAYVGYNEVDHTIAEKFLGISFETAVEFWEKSLKLYLGEADEAKLRAVEEKAMIIGHTRIMRRTIRRNGLNTDEGRAVIENSRKHLEELVPKVDTLLF